MRIKKTDLICGHPAADMRALMRAWGEDASDGEILVKDILKLSTDEANDMVEALRAEGFLERINSECPPEAGHFQRTAKGAALAMASAAPPLRRPFARKKLHELIVRMEKANDDSGFIVGVEEATVFGSYLTSAERLGDIDISYTTFRKIENGETFVKASERAARASGRQFGNYVDFLYWPYQQLRLFLQSRSRAYSLGNDEGLLKDITVPRRVIFKNRRPIPAWRDL
jgi:hypothetical protein